MRVVEEGPAGRPGPPVVLCHGFPELVVLVGATRFPGAGRGRATASSRPGPAGLRRHEPPGRGGTRTTLLHLTDDLLGLLDALGERAGRSFVGHDWGRARWVWQPGRLRGAGSAWPVSWGMSVPPHPRGHRRGPTEIWKRQFAGRVGSTSCTSRRPGVADAELAPRPRHDRCGRLLGRGQRAGRDAGRLGARLAGPRADGRGPGGPPARAGAAAGLAHAGRPRPTTTEVFGRTGFHGAGPELVPELRPETGSSRPTWPAPGSRCRRCFVAGGGRPPCWPWCPPDRMGESVHRPARAR